MDENGNITNRLTRITTRATEYSTPDSMPAVLPPNSGYTYCVELGVDGAERVQFEKPVITFVDNFLGFEVGKAVPVGYYDRDKSAWSPCDNGVVVKLLDTDLDGRVDALDADGDDLPDDLNEDGSTGDEARGLDDPVAYPPDSTFWRIPLHHFSAYDFNWPLYAIEGAEDPDPPAEPHVDQECDNDCKSNVSSCIRPRKAGVHYCPKTL